MKKSEKEKHDTLGWHSLGTTFECECGETHSLPIKKCYVGTDAVERLVDYAREYCGKECMVVADEKYACRRRRRIAFAVCQVPAKLYPLTFSGQTRLTRPKSWAMKSPALPKACRSS